MFAATRLGKGENIAVVERVLGPRVEVGSRYATEGCGGEHVFVAWCEQAMRMALLGPLWYTRLGMLMNRWAVNCEPSHVVYIYILKTFRSRVWNTQLLGMLLPHS
jgi:hypothetical protein